MTIVVGDVEAAKQFFSLFLSGPEGVTVELAQWC